MNEVSGGGIEAHELEHLLDSDAEFDVADWDAKMDTVFNEDYYQVSPSLLR